MKEHEVLRADPGNGQLLAMKRQPKVMGVRVPQQGMLVEEVLANKEAGSHCRVSHEECDHHCSPFPMR